MGNREKKSEKKLDTHRVKKTHFFREPRYQWGLAKKNLKKSWILIGRKKLTFFEKPDTNGVSRKKMVKKTDTHRAKVCPPPQQKTHYRAFSI